MNKKLVWFTELILWAIFIIALILGFTYSFAKADQKNHSYYMFFKDVDGLTKGSPVRMMGYQIGYVRDVKVFKENIFVSFLVTEKNINIPVGSTAQVEFYGLGGSKSLEIVPPSSKPSDNEIIITKNPYRIASYYKWGEQINTTLEAVSTNTSMMLDSYGKSNITIPFLTKSTQKFNSMIQSFVEDDENIIDSLNTKVQSFNKKHKDIETTEENSSKENPENSREETEENERNDN